MRKIILLFTIFGSFLLSAKNDYPKLTIEYRYSNPMDTLQISKLKSDIDFCCYFVLTTKKSDDGLTIIKDTKTGNVLGTLYGKPSKSFLLFLQEKVLTDSNVEDLIKANEKSER